jgi:hypothetical protein
MITGDSEIQYSCSETGDPGGIPAPRFLEARQHVLETASDLMTSSPSTYYVMSFIIRMRYSPETDSCQVVIQPHFSPADEEGGDTGESILTPLSHEIRAAIGEKISAKACGYISASSSLDEDNLTDLFILYFFLSGKNAAGQRRARISGIYQMNITLRTFVPEMEGIAINALERCLALFRQGPGSS